MRGVALAVLAFAGALACGCQTLSSREMASASGDLGPTPNMSGSPGPSTGPRASMSGSIAPPPDEGPFSPPQPDPGILSPPPPPEAIEARTSGSAARAAAARPPVRSNGDVRPAAGVAPAVFHEAPATKPFTLYYAPVSRLAYKRPTRLTLVAAGRSVGTPAQLAGRPGLVVAPVNLTPQVEALLIGNTSLVQIELITGSNARRVRPGLDTTWTWEVTPLVARPFKLTLLVNNIVSVEGAPVREEEKVYEDQFTVVATPVERMMLFMSESNTVMAAVGAFLAALGAFFVALNRTARQALTLIVRPVASAFKRPAPA